MTDEIEPPPGNLPAVIELTPAAPPSKIDQIIEAVLGALTPDDMALVTLEVRDMVSGSKSEPSRVAAAKLLFDHFVPDNLEQKERDAEERHDAIIEVKQLLADLTAAKLDGHEEPHAVAKDSAPGADHPKGS